MARSKKATVQGKQRKETKEEKAARIQSTREARETCERILPLAIGGIFAILLAFAIYVHLTPAQIPAAAPTPQQMKVNPVETPPIIDDAAGGEGSVPREPKVVKTRTIKVGANGNVDAGSIPVDEL